MKLCAFCLNDPAHGPVRTENGVDHRQDREL